MALGSAFQRLGNVLISAFGTPVTLTISGPAAYDPATRSASVGTITTEIDAVIGTYGTGQIQGTVEAGDFPVWIDGTHERPRPGDLITLGDDRGKVVSVKTTYAEGTHALYELQVRL